MVNENRKHAGVCTFVTKPLVKSKCEVRFIYMSAVSFSPSQQSTKHCLKSSGCFESQKNLVKSSRSEMCLLNSVKSSRTRLFYFIKRVPLCRTERVKAKSSKFFFARSSFGTKAVASWQLQVPSEL